MSNRESFNHVADAITECELAAQQLPLDALIRLAATCQNGLADSLDAFNDLYLACDGDAESSVEVMRSITEVTKRATAMAILTLGIARRAHLAAHQN
jgi:hypothetical protein